MSNLYSTSTGTHIASPYAAERVGRNGPLLLADHHHIEVIAHFDRERIPERVVHAKGSGAHGVFEVTHDISDLTSAKLFSKVGTKVSATARFSTVGGESGSADTARDPRGFSVKLRTEEGIWDHVYNNTPVFFIRDPLKFPAFIHTQKRDPQTNRKNADMFWDHLSNNPEAIHQVMILFGDRGIPKGYRHMHGYSGHAHKLVKDDGSFVYAQFHYRCDQPIKYFTQAEGDQLAGTNPDVNAEDLFDAIERQEYPSWTYMVQTMTVEQAEAFEYNILDLTKIWPHAQYPLRPIGKLTLNANVQNYFAEIEQLAFSTSNFPAGIEPSADPVLQSRMFSYPDTQRYRLGANYNQLPVNAPLNAPINFQRGGAGLFVSQGDRPNYESTIKPYKFAGPKYDTSKHEKYLEGAMLDLSAITEKDFEQPRQLYEKVYDADAKARFVSNVAGHLADVKSEVIKNRALALFSAVNADLGQKIAAAINMRPMAPMKSLPASEARAFRAHIDGKEAVKSTGYVG